MPSEEDVKKLAETSDPAEFMEELKKVQGMFAELDARAAAARRRRPRRRRRQAAQRRRGLWRSARRQEGLPQWWRESRRRARAAASGGGEAAAAITEEPSYELAERDGAGGRELFLRVSLPTTDSLAAAELDVSSDGIRLVAGRRLELRWPSAVDADAARNF